MLKLFAGLTLSLLTLSSTVAHAGNARTRLRGGAIGIAQCYYIPGNKTKVEWWLATRSNEEKINFVDFSIEANDNSDKKLYGVVIPSTAKYKDKVIFDDQKRSVTITGQAYSIKLNGIRTFSLEEPLKVNCSK